MLEPGNSDNIEPLSNSYLIELGLVAPYGQDAVQEDMRNFAEQLKPYPWQKLIDLARISKVFFI